MALVKFQETKRSSGQIDMIIAETMKKRFWRSNPKDRTGFWLNSGVYKRFLADADACPIPNDCPANAKKAIGIKPGRMQGENTEIDFSMELVFYIPIPGQKPVYPPHRLSKEGIKAKLASNFAKDCTLDEIDKRVELRDNYNYASDITEWIIADFDSLKEFTPFNSASPRIEYDEVLVEFARNEKKQLTVIISRYNDEQIIKTPDPGSKPTVGFFFDDNDLLP